MINVLNIVTANLLIDILDNTISNFAYIIVVIAAMGLFVDFALQI